MDTDTYFRVLVEYGEQIYAWKGEALHDRQARAIARSQVGRYFNLPKNEHLPVKGWDYCYNKDPDLVFPDIRTMLRTKYSIKGMMKQQDNQTVDLIDLYNFRIEGRTPRCN